MEAKKAGDMNNSKGGVSEEIVPSVAKRLCPSLANCSLCSTSQCAQDELKHKEVCALSSGKRLHPLPRHPLGKRPRFFSPMNFFPPLRRRHVVHSLDAIQAMRRIKTALILCTGLMVVEFVGGIVAGSIAVVSDAAHMLADSSGLAISLFTLWATRLQAKSTHSFGYHRVEVRTFRAGHQRVLPGQTPSFLPQVLGALGTLLTLWFVTALLLREAVDRLLHPRPINGALMFWLALVGVANNVALLFVLGAEHHHHGIGGHSHDHHGHDHSAHGHGHQHASSGRGLLCDSGLVCCPSYIPTRLQDHDVHSHGPKTSLESMALLEEGRGRSEGHHEHSSHSHHGHDHGHHEHSSHDHHDHGHHEHGHHEHGEKLAVRAALAHVIGDSVQAIGVLIAAICIWYRPHTLLWMDPAATFVFSIITGFTSYGVSRDIVQVLLETYPDGMDADK